MAKKSPTQFDDVLKGNREDETVKMLAGNDTWYDNGFFVSDDLIFGGKGDDWMQSISGNDKLVGGVGDDSFQITLRCDPHEGGFDRIVVGGAGLDELTIIDPKFIQDVQDVGNHIEVTDKFGGVLSIYGVEHYSFDT